VFLWFTVGILELTTGHTVSTEEVHFGNSQLSI